MDWQNFKTRQKELSEILKNIPQQHEFINYSVHDNKIFGIPVGGKKSIIGYSVDNIAQHLLYLETKVESLKLQSSFFNNSDSKLNKEIKKYEMYLKRFNNAIKKLEKNNIANIN